MKKDYEDYFANARIDNPDMVGREWFDRAEYLFQVLEPADGVKLADFGIAWSSTLAIPYSMLSHIIPPKNMGLYMGLFNAFIVMPQIIAALGLGWVMDYCLDSNCLLVVVLGGFSLMLAALFIHGVDDVEKVNNQSPSMEMQPTV